MEIMAEETKKKKKFYKRWWFWAIVVIFVIAIGSNGNKGSQTTSAPATTTTNNTNSNSSTSSKPADTPKQETKKITLDDYNSIKAGDTLTGDGGDSYDDVVKKFGEPSTKSESETGGMKMIMAIWSKNLNGDIGANFNVTFNNGKASAKSQSGLK